MIEDCLLNRGKVTRRGYEALHKPSVVSLRLSAALGTSKCLASIHDGRATSEILQCKEANPDNSQSRWKGIFTCFPLPHFADEE